MRRAFSASLVLVALGGQGSAIAQPARDPAGAEVLFRSGVQWLEKGDWARACPEFVASLRLDPSVGTQINIARCAEHDGKLALAWAEFKKAEVLNRETAGDRRKKDIEAFLTQSISALEPKLPWLTLTISPATANVRILRNDVEIATEGLGRAVPVDPGKHTFVATAPGFTESRLEVELKEGERRELLLTLVPLEKTTIEPPPIVPKVPPKEEPKREPKPLPPPESGSALVPAGVVLVSIGGASLVVAAITGGVAAAARGTLDSLATSGCTDAGDTFSCTDPTQADEARSAIDSAGTMSIVSTVTLFGGIAVAGVGAALLGVGLSGESGEEKPAVALVPYASPEGAGLILGGAF